MASEKKDTIEEDWFRNVQVDEIQGENDMLNYFINISIDDDFGIDKNSWGNTQAIRKVEGIKSLSGSSAEVDPSILISKNFWKPVDKLLKYGKRIDEIAESEFASIFSEFGEHEMRGIDDMRFDIDNDYDLVQIHHNIDRISFNYKNSPVYSLYLIQLDDMVKIIIGPYTKDYFVISEWQWVKFAEHLRLDVRENRELKLNDVLGEKTESYTNIIRQLKFLDKSGKTDSFQSSVLDFYEKRGYITESQAKAIKNKL
jgi:hypothetical protein